MKSQAVLQDKTQVKIFLLNRVPDGTASAPLPTGHFAVSHAHLDGMATASNFRLGF